MTPQPDSDQPISFGHELPPEESPAPGKGTIRVLQLYPRDMNIYGDWGNALVLAQRLRWHGYTPELLEYNVGDAFPSDIDLIVGGGGQDSGQLVIQDDLLSRESVLKDLAEDGTPDAGDLRPLPAVREVLQDPDGLRHPGHRHPGRGDPRHGRAADRQRRGVHHRVRHRPGVREPQRPDHPRPGRLSRWGPPPRAPATTAATARKAPATGTSWRATCTDPCCRRTRRWRTSSSGPPSNANTAPSPPAPRTTPTPSSPANTPPAARAEAAVGGVGARAGGGAGLANCRQDRPDNGDDADEDCRPVPRRADSAGTSCPDPRSGRPARPQRWHPGRSSSPSG